MRLLLLMISVVAGAFAGEPLTQNLYPAGGGSFSIQLSACKEKAPVLNGYLTNNTDTTWLYIELQVKVTQGNVTATYRFNLERIGEKGGTIQHKIEGLTDLDCESIRLSSLELIAARTDARAAGKKL